MHQISGKVVKGKGYGRKIGFPTVNLDTVDKLPKSGIYSGVGILDQKEYKSGIVIYDDKVEAHLIGYEGDAYGENVTLKLDQFLREYKEFKNEEELKKQIKEDIKLC